MTIRLDELCICASCMSLMRFTGQSPPSATSTRFKFTDLEIQESIKYFVISNPRGYIAPDPSRRVNPDRKFPGPLKSSVSSTVWKFGCEYSRNCAQGCEEKIGSSRAALLPFSLGDFPVQFFQQERVDPKAAKKQLSGR